MRVYVDVYVYVCRLACGCVCMGMLMTTHVCVSMYAMCRLMRMRT